MAFYGKKISDLGPDQKHVDNFTSAVNGSNKMRSENVRKIDFTSLNKRTDLEDE